jgi:hypothetical protein
MADQTRLETEFLIDEKLQYLQSAPLEVIQQICLQYRYFTKNYPDTLGVLVSKIPYGNFKCLMAEILAEELGNGQLENAHLKMWDDFLLSIGVSQDELDNSAIPDNMALLEDLLELTKNESTLYAVGLRGMGGECLCQVYLSAMHKYMLKNPYFQKNQSDINWTFWDIHVGEADIIHNQLVRQAINNMVDAEPESVDELTAGYQKAKESWGVYWNNIYDLARTKQMSMVN